MNEGKIYINYLGEECVLRTAIVGGWTDGEESKPMTMYGGPLEPEEMVHSLLYVNRAVLKILVNEFDLKLKDAVEVLADVLKESYLQELHSVVNEQNDVSIKTVVKSIKRDMP